MISEQLRQRTCDIWTPLVDWTSESRCRASVRSGLRATSLARPSQATVVPQGTYPICAEPTRTLGVASSSCRKGATPVMRSLRDAPPSGYYRFMGTGARDHLTPAVRFKDGHLRLLLAGAGKSNYWRLRYLASGIGCMCPVQSGGTAGRSHRSPADPSRGGDRRSDGPAFQLPGIHRPNGRATPPGSHAPACTAGARRGASEVFSLALAQPRLSSPQATGSASARSSQGSARSGQAALKP
jgi:hypothetical protein